MDKLQRIEEMEQQLAALKAEVEREAKPKQWEPEGGRFCIRGNGEICSLNSHASTRNFGIERKTKEQAEKAAAAMRTHNRLLAYVAEFAPDYEPDWDDGEFCIEYAHNAKEYLVDKNFLQRIGAVYMPKHVAIELCRKLNSGEVVL